MSLGGSMTNSLLLVAYTGTKNKDKNVQISLRYTTEYSLLGVYEGNATIIPIRSEVTEESFTTIFHCRECLHWAQGRSEGSAVTSSGTLDLAFAISPEGPGNSECPGEAKLVQHKAQGTCLAFVDEKATSAEYEEWAKLGKEEGAGGCSSKR
jgi:cellobiose dehydrogenase (acceptor)